MTKNVTDEALAKVWNDTDKYPTTKLAAQKLDLNVSTLTKRVSRIRNRWIEGDQTAIQLIFRNADIDVPLLSETYGSKTISDEVDLISELRRLYLRDPSRNLTRNYFHKETGIKDSQWNCFFGTFQEFKRSAFIYLNRHQHKVEREVAKHKAHDHYKQANDRHNWGENYLKPTGRKYQTLLIGSDFHDVDCDPFYIRCFIDTARRAQPDIIVLAGDIYDLPEFSRFNVDPRSWDVVKRINWVLDVLRQLREACPDAQIDFFEGNHEFRLIRHLCDQSQALKVVLSDLHGWDTKQLLGLDEFELNYISKADLATFNKADITKELKKNWKLYFNAFCVSHYPSAKKRGYPGVNGHHHKHLVWTIENARYGCSEWHQLGCGHVLDASYCEAESIWNNGFALTHINTQSKISNIEYIPVTSHAVIGGTFYERNKSEMVGWYKK